MTCLFCDTPESEVVLKNDLCYSRWDKYPVTKGHLLIIPFRHYDNYFDSTQDEITAFWQLIKEAKELINKKYQPDGYNVGINVGKTAGQTVMHTHIHLIPRYAGDVKQPRGGIRGVIPGKQNY